MRVISNRSTGRLGQIMARDLAEQGSKVTLLEGAVQEPLQFPRIRIVKFLSFAEFAKLIERELKRKYTIVIHAAAVADYQLKRPFKEKISSKRKMLSLTLIPTPKIIERMKRLNPHIFLIGFKWEDRLTKVSIRQKSRQLFQKAQCDLVVVNAVHGQRYAGSVVDRRGDILTLKKTRKGISRALIKILQSKSVGIL